MRSGWKHAGSPVTTQVRAPGNFSQGCNSQFRFFDFTKLLGSTHFPAAALHAPGCRHDRRRAASARLMLASHGKPGHLPRRIPGSTASALPLRPVNAQTRAATGGHRSRREHENRSSAFNTTPSAHSRCCRGPRLCAAGTGAAFLFPRRVPRRCAPTSRS